MPNFSLLHRLLAPRPRFTYLVLSLLLIIPAIYGGGVLYQRHLEHDWQTIVREREADLLREIQSKFSAYQRATVGEVVQVAHSEHLAGALTGGGKKSPASVFDVLAGETAPGLSLEVFDGTKQLVGWSGNRGTESDTAHLAASVKSLVLEGPISTYLFVSVPIQAGTSERWFLGGKRLLDLNYPISNRLITNDAFAATFSSGLSVDADFDFTAPFAVSQDEKVLSIPMISLSGDTLGFAYVQRPSLPAYLEEAQARVTRLVNLILLLLIVVIVMVVIPPLNAMTSPPLRALFFTLGIWLIRYVMVWLNVPQSMVASTLFDAADFASRFGFGIAKSIGDMCISSLFLLLNVIYVSAQFVARRVPMLESASRRDTAVGLQERTLRGLAFIGAAVILFLCLRGFAATVLSAVFDSTLLYNDPTFVLPPVELAVMLLSLLLIAISMVVLGLTVVGATMTGIDTIARGRMGVALSWLTTAAAMGGLGLAYGALFSNPLLGQLQRLLYVEAFVIVAWLIPGFPLGAFSLFRFRSLLLMVALAASFLIPLLDETVHKLDRVHVELLSNEILRPTDTWLKVVVKRALDEFSNPEAAEVIASGEGEAKEKLAFTQWAKSILSREANNCSIDIVDTNRNVVSSFHIGVASHHERGPSPDISLSQRFFDVQKDEANGITYVRGYAPVTGAKGEVAGGVWIEISAGWQSILGGDVANLLKNTARQPFDPRLRRLNISEYYDGKLISTTEESIPLDRPLPGELQSDPRSAQWLEEEIEGKSYETYYIPSQVGGGKPSWAALSMEGLGLRWHVYSYLRYLVFYLVLFLLAALGYLLVQFVRRHAMVATYRVKLLVTFVIVSMIPAIVIGYYNRQYAVERVEESTLKRLSDQTAIVAAELQLQSGVNAPYLLSNVSDEQCFSIADRVDADFNVYYGRDLQASSKREVFTAELLDERVSADAYVNIMVKKKGFFAENQSIGKLPYIVGYRPIVSQSGATIGMVSVPTLFRQSEVDEELTRRNVFLFGAYALALFISLGVGTFFANQISSPIIKLKNATRQVAQGMWDLRLRSGRRDEIGELEQAFETMARDLKNSQDQMLKAQREEAWKEMAKQVAHEIKNPLTPMKLSIQHLQRAYTDNIKDFGVVLRQVCATVLEQVEALSRIASEFSHFARMPEKKLTHCDVHEVLDEAANLFAQQTSVEMIKEFHADRRIVVADREELRRAFINVIRNAIQAMKERGTLRLTTTSDGDIIVIELADTGPGIPPEVRARLFEPNFSTKTDGMGLGLSIVKKTVDDLGGTIAIDSAPGKGTAVTMKLLLSLDHD